jgi:UPF0755 protein
MARRIALLLLLLLAGAGWLAYELFRPYRAFESAVFVDFQRGTGTRQMAAQLAEAGVISHAWEFLVLRALERGRTLQAGEYRFEKPASTFQVFDRIARGDVFYYELLIPEGKNIFEIAAAVSDLGLFPAAKFLTAARDPASIKDLDPRAPSLEGYLFPNTYRVDRHITPEALCRMMTNRFREVWRSLNATASLHDTVTLASLIEKEAGVAADRPRVASVFANRLRIGMKLDCDPTTIYAALLDSRYRGVIHQSDLASENPYNTYRHAGLPPGPIANPGREALEAALHPAETDSLYFVLRADGSGAHTFSSTMAAHEAAIAQYRRGNHIKSLKEAQARRNHR